MRLILSSELQKVREKISCKQFGDDHWGEWGILTLNQRRTILRMIETIQYLERTIDEAVIGNHPPFKNKADVAEVKHSEWILHNDGSGTCKRCGFTQKNVWDYDNWQNFCGHCGAKMDGKGD